MPAGHVGNYSFARPEEIVGKELSLARGEQFPNSEIDKRTWGTPKKKKELKQKRQTEYENRFEEFCSLRQAGYKYEEISDKMDLSPWTLKQKKYSKRYYEKTGAMKGTEVSKAKYEKRYQKYKEMRSSGQPLDKIAQELNMSIKSLSLPRYAKRYREETGVTKDNYLRREYEKKYLKFKAYMEEGDSLEAIARKMKLNKTYLSSKRYLIRYKKEKGMITFEKTQRGYEKRYAEFCKHIEEGLSLQEIENAMNLSESTVFSYKYIGRYNKENGLESPAMKRDRKYEENYQRFKELRNEGRTRQVIADILGLSIRTIDGPKYVKRYKDETGAKPWARRQLNSLI